jgi:two-component system, sporulation sensor kinase B
MNNDLGSLLSLISHEVRNPLGVTRGYMRLLEQQAGTMSESQRQAVAASLRATDRANDILNQMSALARFYRGEVTLARQRTTVAPLPSDPLVTTHVVDTPELEITADPEMLQSAISLLTTAVIRGQPADTRVNLRAHAQSREHSDGVSIEIMCVHNGDGASAHDLDVTRGGLGLDLPIATCIARAHGGDIREHRLGKRLVGIVLWLPGETAD